MPLSLASLVFRLLPLILTPKRNSRSHISIVESYKSHTKVPCRISDKLSTTIAITQRNTKTGHAKRLRIRSPPFRLQISLTVSTFVSTMHPIVIFSISKSTSSPSIQFLHRYILPQHH